MEKDFIHNMASGVVGKEPVPVLVTEKGKYRARWSQDDAMMRSRNRSILERPDSIETVDDAFLDALRSDNPEVKWKSEDDLRDLERRLSAWRLSAPDDSAARSKVSFRIQPPEGDGAVADLPPAMRWWERAFLSCKPGRNRLP